MRRREFIASVAALGAWSASVRAQQPQRLRKLAIIMAAGKTPEYVAAVAALEQALGSLGWKNGENLQIDERWSAGSEDGARSAAREIVASNPDIILGQSAAVIEALQSATRTTPIVFLHVADPAVYGFVSNLARPERKFNRHYQYRSVNWRKVAAVAQRDSAGGDAADNACQSGYPAGSRRNFPYSV